MMAPAPRPVDAPWPLHLEHGRGVWRRALAVLVVACVVPVGALWVMVIR